MKDLAKVPMSTNPLGKVGKPAPRTCREAWGSDLTDPGYRKEDRWVLITVLVCVVLVLLFAGCSPSRPAVKQLNCETVEECEARLAAGLPLWKGEEK